MKLIALNATFLCLLAGSLTANARPVFNEIVSQPVDDEQDWLELKNTSNEAVDLSNYTLTDSEDGAPHPSHLYEFEPETVLLANSYLLLKKDENNSFDFGLGQSDGLYLYDADGTLVDHTSWQENDAPTGTSWGRFPDGTGDFQTLMNTSPEEANDGTPYVDHTDVKQSDYIYDEQAIRSYHLQMSDEDWQWLQENPTLEEYVPGNVLFEGQTYGQAGIRFKGGVGSLEGCVDDEGNIICDKLSMKVSFNEYDDDGRFYGLKKLQFHGMVNDPSKLHDSLGYWLFRQFEVYAPRTAFARLIVNGEFLGLFVVVEHIDGRYARYNYPDGGEGNIYKQVWPLHFDEGPYLEALETNEDDNPDVSAMVGFATDIANSEGPAFRQSIEKWMDVSQTMRYLAVDRGINHWDGPMGWSCITRVNCWNHNYFWYQTTDSNTMMFIPWDLDYAFWPDDPWEVYFGATLVEWYEKAPCHPQKVKALYGIMPASCDPLLGGFSREMWEDYTLAAREFLDGPYSEHSLEDRLLFLETQIRPFIEEDPDLDLETWEADLTLFRTDLQILRERLQFQLSL